MCANMPAHIAIWWCWDMVDVQTGMPVPSYSIAHGTCSGCHMAVLVHRRYKNRHARAAFMAKLGTVYVQVCGPKVPHDGPGLWQTYKHVFLHCLVLVLEHIRCVKR